MILEELGMFADLGDVLRSNLFSITDTDLNVIGRIAEAFIKIEFHKRSPRRIIAETRNTSNTCNIKFYNLTMQKKEKEIQGKKGYKNLCSGISFVYCVFGNWWHCSVLNP